MTYTRCSGIVEKAESWLEDPARACIILWVQIYFLNTIWRNCIIIDWWFNFTRFEDFISYLITDKFYIYIYISLYDLLSMHGVNDLMISGLWAFKIWNYRNYIELDFICDFSNGLVNWWFLKSCQIIWALISRMHHTIPVLYI